MDPRLLQNFQDMENNPFWINHRNDIAKALTAGYATDAAALTGGQAMIPESLEQRLITTTYEEKHAVLWGILKKNPEFASIAQWVERSEYGDSDRYAGGATGESNNPGSMTSTLARKLAEMKYLRNRRDVSHPMTLYKSIQDAMVEEEVAGTRHIIRMAERLLFDGDSNALPTEFDGLWKIIEDRGAADNVVDVYRHADADNHHLSKKLMEYGAATIFKDGFGIPTDLFFSPHDQSDRTGTSEFLSRVAVPVTPDGLVEGTPAVGYNSSYGLIKYRPDVFITPGELAPTAVAGESTRPATPTLNALTSPASDGATSFTGDWDDKAYYYKVAAINEFGRSAPCAAQAVTPTTGDMVRLDISTADATTTGYVVYRSPAGAADGTNCRFIFRGAYTDGANDYLYDRNDDLPGLTKAFMGNFTPEALSIQQLLPLMKFPLAVSSPSYPFLVMLYMVLRVLKPKQFVVFKNIMPANLTFDPLTP